VRTTLAFRHLYPADFIISLITCVQAGLPFDLRTFCRAFIVQVVRLTPWLEGGECRRANTVSRKASISAFRCLFVWVIIAFIPRSSYLCQYLATVSRDELNMRPIALNEKPFLRNIIVAACFLCFRLLLANSLLRIESSSWLKIAWSSSGIPF